jgi:acyl-CoA thioesterase FadM
LFRIEIIKKANNKLAANGSFLNALINTKTGQTEAIPDRVIAQYRQFLE